MPILSQRAGWKMRKVALAVVGLWRRRWIRILAEPRHLPHSEKVGGFYLEERKRAGDSEGDFSVIGISFEGKVMGSFGSGEL